MQLVIDHKRGKELALLLYDLFSTKGIFGKTIMPEDLTPEGVLKGSIEHILFMTQTVSIDYQRDAGALWASARRTYEDKETKYLFNPQELAKTPLNRTTQDMQKYKLSKKITKDAVIWKTIGTALYNKWKGNPCNFLNSCKWDALSILDRLKNDTSMYNSKQVPDYPYLRGSKIGPLWLRMLRDNAGISQLQNLDKVPIPVDIHIARSSLTTGIIRGHYKGSLISLFDYVRDAWFKSVKGISIKNR